MFEMNKAATTLDSPDEVQIFKEGIGPASANRIVDRLPDKNPSIAIAETYPSKIRINPGHLPGRVVIAFENEGEVAPSDIRILQSPFNRLDCSGCWVRVRVDNPQRLPLCLRGGSADLSSATPRATYNSNSHPKCDLHGAVFASTIGDEYFFLPCQRLQCSKRTGDPRLFVQSRHNYADHVILGLSGIMLGMLRPLFIIFAKAPVPGRVKTRLCPPLTANEASSLHVALVSDAVEMLFTLSDLADVELSTDVPTEIWNELAVARSIQSGGDLGMRLFHSLERGIATGRKVVTVLGSDSPGLPSAHLLELMNSAADVTLGPTADGGFYGISCRSVHRDMFDGVRWSSEHTLQDVVAAASASSLTVATGPDWFDIDVETDLLRLLKMPDLPNWTATWARRYQQR